MRRVVGDYIVDLFSKESNKEFFIKQSKIRNH